MLQDGLDRRGYKESGFLNAVAEVVATGKVDPSIGEENVVRCLYLCCRVIF